MPRTRPAGKLKQSRDSSADVYSIKKDFERQCKLLQQKFQGEYEMKMRSLESDITFSLTNVPLDIKKLSFSEILSRDYKENNYKEPDSSFENVDKSFVSPPPSNLKFKKQDKRTTVTSDDGYVTEGGTRQSRATTTSSKLRLRSSSRSRKTKLTNSVQKTATKPTSNYTNQSKMNSNKFKTPANLKPSMNEFEPVTPKVKPNTPMSILRRPREGEMVLSMQGSPLLVSAVIQERSANVNVPLNNGDVISLLPRDGLRLSNIPNLDAETVRQLQTLKGHIEKVINSK
ncbi:borealin-like [Leptopilina boulardi]|uniref:borealin-like n=1 Tax=Leptopilina boulardi TaxID=63433 RepID=UPI0021F54046|nr:borealin-like [Leptopilina boulardi]XP_051173572.1 borealin-like [Leptopilina boulardi]XP_051173581.1 borealin-like [Leptopilina boulardi]